jgi:chorismate mutase
MASQQQELRELREQMELGIDSVPPTQRAGEVKPANESPKDVNVERTVVQAAPTLVAPNGDPTPTLEHSMRAVVEEVKDEEKQARLERNKEAREKRVKDRVSRVTPELGLDAYQAGQLNKVLLDAEEKLADLRSSMRQPDAGTSSSQRDRLAEIMAQRDQQLKTVLSGSQMEKLADTEPRRRWTRKLQDDSGQQARKRDRNGKRNSDESSGEDRKSNSGG